MKAVVIGCGRVGSAVATQLAAEGWDVTAVDEKEEAPAGSGWKGGFVVGHGMDGRSSARRDRMPTRRRSHDGDFPTS
jgi:glycine/D-amino acid oxidase-like deaminating enzyme